MIHSPFNTSGTAESREISHARRPSSRQFLEFDRLLLTRLSANFVLRDLMFSSEAALMGLANLPEDPDAVVRAGRDLCQKILEPIEARFGRFAITFAYQCREAIERSVLGRSTRGNHRSSAPHQFDRKSWGDETYARIDILPYCVEDGYVSKCDFGRWLMHNLDVCLLMTWSRSNVHCITISPQPRRVWLEWGRPKMGECRQIFFMGANYWQRTYPTLPVDERPKFCPSHSNGLIWWPNQAR